MSVILFVAAALATPPGPIAQGFLISTRDDAPTDARLLFDANYEVTASLSAGPGAPATLEVETLTWPTYWAAAVISPPATGWTAGEAHTVTVSTPDQYGTPVESFELAFGVGAGPAADPTAPEVLEVTIGEWSDEELTYPNGCCEVIRTVTVRLRNADPDPWSFVEVLGHTPGRPTPQRLELAFGTGEFTLGFTQWEEDGQIQPDELRFVGIAADGDRSDEVVVDVSEGPLPAGDTGESGGSGAGSGNGCGCQGAPGPAGALALVGVVLGARRRRVQGNWTRSSSSTGQ